MIHTDQDKFLKAFLEESSELLDALNEKLLALEKYPEDINIINEIFRITHSIKSESALVGFMKISELAHKMEDIFEKIRKGELIVNSEIINTIYIAYDKMIEIMSAVQNNEDESSFNITDEINSLSFILKKFPLTDKTEKLKDKVDIKKEKKGLIKDLDIEFSDNEKNQIEDGLERGEKLYKATIKIDDDCEMKYPRAYLVFNNFGSKGTIVKTIPDVLTEADDSKYSIVDFFVLSDLDNEILKKCTDVDQVAIKEFGNIGLRVLKDLGLNLSDVPGYTDMLISQEEIDEGERIEREWEKQFEKEIQEKGLDKTLEEEDKALTTDQVMMQRTQRKDHKSFVKQTIRVDTDRLDTMMNLVGELIINHSRFSQIKNKITDTTSIALIKSEIEDATNELERISDQMQMGMMHVRMVPISNVFSKFPRMVRDLANSLNKKVNLILEGEDTEIDRAIVELITEPLTHIIRNSIDHGIEMPEVRERKGKPKEGIINLKAYQQGSNIYIEIIDDGKGISIEKIKEKAIEKEIISIQWLNQMSDDEVLNLIFEPGFSTKDEITGLSGRGVGMDVVKSQVKKLRGDINVDTSFGSGTKITIIFPLTLTIVEALLVEVDKSIFAIPVNVIEETLKIRIDEIKDFDEYKVYNLRDETLAILHLSELVGINTKKDKDEVYVVVVFYEKRKIGFIVDELIGGQDIVIKALDESLKTLEGISGATVLGDGKIAIILDINSLVKVRKKEIGKATKDYDYYSSDDAKLDILYDELNKDLITDKKDKIDYKKAEKIDNSISDEINKIYDSINKDNIVDKDEINDFYDKVNKDDTILKHGEVDKKKLEKDVIKDDKEIKEKNNLKNGGLLSKALKYKNGNGNEVKKNAKKDNADNLGVEIDLDLDDF